MKIYLASKSPRRRELLDQMEVPYQLLAVDTPEVVEPNESPITYSQRITHEKLEAAWHKMCVEQLEYLPILCADTEVVLDGVILGKPHDEKDAFNMLKAYSGKTHQVITSVGLKYEAYETVRLNTTHVTFSNISDEAIRHYLSSGNYKDKSGSYGIQSYIGQFISHIEGCFYSVMGLPLNTVREMLLDLREKTQEERGQ